MIAVGIDVSKSKSTVAILNSDGTPLVRPFNMAHTLSEMNDLVKRLRALDSPVTILMEYTGHYHYPVLKKLQTEGFPVCLINPYQMKKTPLRVVKFGSLLKINIGFLKLEKLTLPKYSVL